MQQTLYLLWLMLMRGERVRAVYSTHLPPSSSLPPSVIKKHNQHLIIPDLHGNSMNIMMLFLRVGGT